MRRGRRPVDYEYWLPGALIGLLFLIGCFQIFSRFIFSYPLTWGEEAMRLSFLLLVFFGAFAVTKNRAHLLVDLINIYGRPKMSVRCWKSYEVVVLIVQASFFALCAYGSFQMAAVRWNIVSQTMPFWRIGFMYVLTGSAFLACSLASVYLIFHDKKEEEAGS